MRRLITFVSRVLLNEVIHLYTLDILTVLLVHFIESLGALLDDVADDRVANHGEHYLRGYLRRVATQHEVIALVTDEHERCLLALQRVELLLHVVEYLLDFFFLHNIAVLDVLFRLIATDNDSMVALVNRDTRLPRTDVADAILWHTSLQEQVGQC